MNRLTRRAKPHSTGIFSRCLLFLPALLLTCALHVSADDGGLSRRTEPIVVRNAEMDINYQVAVCPEDLDRVELWYTCGRNDTWNFYAYDQDHISPVRFKAPTEGIFRILIVAVDRWGRYSFGCDEKFQPVQPGHIPRQVPGQLEIFVDYSMPQLHFDQLSGNLDDYKADQITLRWAGFDANLSTKPIQLFYQRANSENWVAITEPLPAVGEFTWKFPAELSGPFVVKAVLTDRAGNCESKCSGRINLVRKPPPELGPQEGDIPIKTVSSDNAVKQIDKLNTVTGQAEDYDDSLAYLQKFSLEAHILPHTEKKQINPDQQPSVSPVALPAKTDDAKQEAQKYFRRGKLHFERFEYPQAAQAYQKALECDPTLLEARLKLAKTLFWMCQFEQSEKHYRRCRADEPENKTALYGLAQTHIALKQYDLAQESLDKLLQLDSQDWQVWLLRGDVAEKRNQRSVALKSWRQAANDLSPVKARARELLEKYEP